MTLEHRGESEELLVDPEIFSALMIALGAVGSVASIVSLLEQRGQAREANRNANRFAIRDALTGCETALNELRALVRSLEILLNSGAGLRDWRHSLVGFGRVELRFTRDGHERWREIEEDILRTSGRVQRHMNDLMRHFATTDLRLRPEAAHAVSDLVESLNGVALNLRESHFERLFASLYEVIGKGESVMTMLHSELEAWLR